MDYSDKTVLKLKELCKEQGLPVSGTRAVLVERLINASLPQTTLSSKLPVPSLEVCKEIWSLIHPIAREKGPKLFLGRTLLKKEHGKRPGGMGTSSIEEDLWTTEFRLANILCEFICTQADCAIRCSVPCPVSIKCTSSAMAVNWGKNKNKIKFVFVAPILIIYHRPNSPSTARKELQSGAYLVDPEWCNEHVKLTSNNKTDYLITDATATQMLLRAKSMKFYHEIEAMPDKETHFVMRDPHKRQVYVAKMPSSDALAKMVD
jgi:hypothetical protein